MAQKGIQCKNLQLLWLAIELEAVELPHHSTVWAQ